MPRFHPLLADAESLAPYIPQGIPATALRDLPRPPIPAALPDSVLGDKGAAPDDLKAQRWGIVVPKEKSDRVRLVAPLVAHRKKQQGGAEPCVYEAPPGLDADKAVQWMRDEYQNGRVPIRERPRYLMLLGDLDELSEDLQHALATQAFVGRLALRDEDAYARYCQKVIASETSAPGPKPRLVLHATTAATPDDLASRLAQEQLIHPCLAEAQRVGLSVSDTSDASWTGLLDAIAQPGPAVLLTVCHGLGIPARGWSRAEQHRLQGALRLGLEQKQVLTAAVAQQRRLLPGGIWFMLSCFSAATPVASAYEPWMDCFPEEEQAELRQVLDGSRPRDGRPFLSALPAALLGNPDGPVAILGHSDIAWVDLYYDPAHPNRSTAMRVLEPLHLLAEGRPAGVALDALLDACRQEEQALLHLYAKAAREAVKEDAAREAVKEDEARVLDEDRRAQAWLGRQDLRSYLLLGDPAARLPCPPAAEAAKKEERAESAARRRRNLAGILGLPLETPAAGGAASERSAEEMEEAVLAVLREREEPGDIAARYGISEAKLEQWVTEYREGGRAMLSRLT